MNHYIGKLNSSIETKNENVKRVSDSLSENNLYHNIFTFLIINKYETLSNLKEYEAFDFFYLAEIALRAEFERVESLKKSF